MSAMTAPAIPIQVLQVIVRTLLSVEGSYRSNTWPSCLRRGKHAISLSPTKECIKICGLGRCHFSERVDWFGEPSIVILQVVASPSARDDHRKMTCQIKVSYLVAL